MLPEEFLRDLPAVLALLGIAWWAVGLANRIAVIEARTEEQYKALSAQIADLKHMLEARDHGPSRAISSQ